MHPGVALFLLLLAPWLLGSESQSWAGLAGGLLILALPFLLLRGFWLFMDDVRRRGRGDRR